MFWNFYHFYDMLRVRQYANSSSFCLILYQYWYYRVNKRIYNSHRLVKVLKIQGFSKSGTRGNMWRYNSGELRLGTSSKFYFWFHLRLVIILTKIYRDSFRRTEAKLVWKSTIPPLPSWTSNKPMPDSVSLPIW